MTDQDAAAIELAQASPLLRYRWPDRGRSPKGYLSGMAVAFARLHRRLAAGDEVARALSAPAGADGGKDVLRWYAEEFAALAIPGETAQDRLIQVMSILIGLGMRESSGRHCEGRDLSAKNVTALTAETGLFQVSFNSVRAHPLLARLIEDYRGRDDLIDIFDDGVTCTRSEWRNWGDGAGRDFQALTKSCPAFAVDYAALLLRHRRSHWGPINRKTAEVRSEAVRLLVDVADRIDAQA